jgi:hypothetical protein
MAKIIIGIHGLGNKPPKKLLSKWWKQSIREGLKAKGYFLPFYRFKMVYWADHLHIQPLEPKVKDPDHPLFLKEPYTPSSDEKKHIPSRFRQKMLDQLEKQLDRLFLKKDQSIHFAGITDFIIEHFFQDLNIYYSKNCLDKKHLNKQAKEVIRKKLYRTLRRHRHKEIMLISHSMGSIISYDVMALEHKHVKVETFVTLGSPLGLPVIMSKIAHELGQPGKRLKTPESIRHAWYNMSDLRDKVAINYTLADDYDANSKGVRALDIPVYNDYEGREKHNPHKVYGYLRTPEMADIIQSFLIRNKPTYYLKFVQFLNQWFNLKAKKTSR